MSEDSKRSRSEPSDAAVRDATTGAPAQPPPAAPDTVDGNASDPQPSALPGDEEVPEAETEASLAGQLEALQAELAEQKDRYLRAAAEADNIRRRADNDTTNARKFAIGSFALEILTVRDSLEIARAVQLDEDQAGAVAKMKEGLDLTLKQLDSALAKFSVEVVEPNKGEKLDPDRHQAMSTQESDNVPPNHILSVLQKGYTIHDRLLRPAMVVVAKKPDHDAQTAGETA